MIRHPSKEAWAQTENLLDLGGSWLIQERVSTAYLHQTNMTASAGHTVGCLRAAEVCAVGFGWFRGCFGCLAVWNPLLPFFLLRSPFQQPGLTESEGKNNGGKINNSVSCGCTTVIIFFSLKDGETPKTNEKTNQFSNSELSVRSFGGDFQYKSLI